MLDRRADSAETGFVGSLPLTTSEEIKEEEQLQTSEVEAAQGSEGKQQEGLSEPAKSPSQPSAPLVRDEEQPAETQAKEPKAPSAAAVEPPEEANKPIAAKAPAPAVLEEATHSHPPPEPSKPQSAAIPPMQAAIPAKPVSEAPVKPAPIQPAESSVSGAVAAPHKQEAASLPKLAPSKPLFEEPASQTKHDLPRKEAEVKPAEKVGESGGALMVVAGVAGVAALGLIWLWTRSRK